MAERLFSNKAKDLTLNAGISASDGTIVLTAGHGALLPNPGPGEFFNIRISEGANEEYVRISARATDSLTASLRGDLESTAQAFTTAAKVSLVTSADMFGTGPWGILGFRPLWARSQMIILPGTTGTSLSTLGCAVSTTGTISHPAHTPGTKWSSRRLWRQATAATNASQSSMASANGASNQAAVSRGSVAGAGGFLFAGRLYIDEAPAGAEPSIFMGLANLSTANPIPNPAAAGTTVAKIGIGKDTTQTALRFIHNAQGVAPTVAFTFPNNIAVGDYFDLFLWARPNASGIKYRVEDGSRETIVGQGEITTNLPGTTTLLAMCAGIYNHVAAARTMSVGYLSVDTPQ